MSDAPERITAMATREGAFWKKSRNDPTDWFGESFSRVEYSHPAPSPKPLKQPLRRGWIPQRPFLLGANCSAGVGYGDSIEINERMM